MAYQGPLPAGDGEFDILQEIIVAAAVANATGWKIPATEITKLTDAQAPWNSTWAIAKNKQNTTTAQREAKRTARKNYSKVLRPFIQKWIYRNENMNDSHVEQCGLKPRGSGNPSTALFEGLTITVRRGEPGELITSCKVLRGARSYGCIMVESGTLPDWFMLSPEGHLTFIAAKFKPEQNKIVTIQTDLNPQRTKKFARLKPGTTYYFYYYVISAAGVSGLSEPVSMVCW